MVGEGTRRQAITGRYCIVYTYLTKRQVGATILGMTYQYHLGAWYMTNHNNR